MGILSIYLNNINLVDTNYIDDDPKNIIHVKLSDWHSKFEKRKALRNRKKKINAYGVAS